MKGMEMLAEKMLGAPLTPQGIADKFLPGVNIAELTEQAKMVGDKFQQAFVTLDGLDRKMDRIITLMEELNARRADSDSEASADFFGTVSAVGGNTCSNCDSPDRCISDSIVTGYTTCGLERKD